MTREKFIRLTGWGMILSGVSLLLGFLASNMDAILGRSLMGREYERYEAISNVLLITGSLLLMFGLIGLLLRYGKQSGRAGKLALMGGVFFSLLSMLGGWGLSISDTSWAWTTWFIGFTMIFVCLALFGLLTLRQKLLPRWNALPLLAGIGIPLYVLISIIWEALTPGSGWVDDQGFGLLMLLLTMTGLGFLGFILQGDSSLKSATA